MLQLHTCRCFRVAVAKSLQAEKCRATRRAADRRPPVIPRRTCCPSSSLRGAPDPALLVPLADPWWALLGSSGTGDLFSEAEFVSLKARRAKPAHRNATGGALAFDVRREAAARFPGPNWTGENTVRIAEGLKGAGNRVESGGTHDGWRTCLIKSNQAGIGFRWWRGQERRLNA